MVGSCAGEETASVRRIVERVQRTLVRSWSDAPVGPPAPSTSSGAKMAWTFRASLPRPRANPLALRAANRCYFVPGQNPDRGVSMTADGTRIAAAVAFLIVSTGSAL